MDSEDTALAVLLESAKEAFREIQRGDSKFEFTEKDFLTLVTTIWNERFTSESLGFKSECSEILIREGIDED